MRAQIKQLKSEKMRMMKRMKDEAERVRQITERNQREIQSLRLMELLKRTTTPKSFTKAFRNHIRKQSISRNDEDRKESRRSSDDFSPIYDEVFASGYDKKKLLDEIHSLQSSIAGEYSKESEDKSRKNSIKSSKIERNLDEYESYTILESFFKEIVDNWTRKDNYGFKKNFIGHAKGCSSYNK
ncbi:unnamed protein product [Rhizophagus irregularis]|nr:unnamed protein product [Rhizophagus irregularis]